MAADAAPDGRRPGGGGGPAPARAQAIPHKGRGQSDAQRQLPEWALYDIPRGAALRVRGYAATHLAHTIRRQDVPEWRVAIIPRRVHRGASVATVAESTRIPEPHCFKRPSGAQKSGADFRLTAAEAIALCGAVPLRRPCPPTWWEAAGVPPPIPPPSRPLPLQGRQMGAAAGPAAGLPRVQALRVPNASDVVAAAAAAGAAPGAVSQMMGGPGNVMQFGVAAPGPPPPPPPP
eukprot:gene19502-biopygen31312